MPLISRSKHPPGGFAYFEPALNWRAPRDGAGFDIRSRQIQSVRIANPGPSNAAGLSTALSACEDALDAYVCAQLGNDPNWCVGADDPVAKAAAQSRAATGCASCGQRRRRSP